MSAAPLRPPWYKFLYTHNPFYAISAALLIYGIRAGFGELEIGSINCWIMFGVLTGYTLLLATIAVAIIRWGNVWDDARSLLLLLLLLFLGISVSTDDLLVNSTSWLTGGAIVLGCFLGTSLLSEVVLRAARIRLPWGFRGPYHLMLALFCLFPWFCSPAIRPESSQSLEWFIFLFPTMAAVLFALLLPAVRKGANYVSNNGTPWPWPLYPWTIFGVLAGVTAFRSFVLTMTYGPLGPIWNGAGNSLAAINFDTIFGAYFLVPLAFVLMWLALEATLVSQNRSLQRQLIFAAPMLLVMAYPFGNSPVFLSFLGRFTEQCGSPVWLTCGLLLLFYTRAWLGRVPEATAAITAVLLLLVFIQPDMFRTVDHLNPWPLLAVGVLAAVLGIRKKSSAYSFVSLCVATTALWMMLPESVSMILRQAAAVHLMWGGSIVLGLLFQDRFAEFLRKIGAGLIPLTTLAVLLDQRWEMMPIEMRNGYLFSLVAVALAIALSLRQREYLYAFYATMTFIVYVGAAAIFRQVGNMVGREALAALSWSVAALVVAFLISASKANWLPLQRNSFWLPNTEPVPDETIPSEENAETLPPDASDEA